MSKISRRAFLTGTGSLVVAFSFPLMSTRAEDQSSSDEVNPDPVQETSDTSSSSAEYTQNIYIEITLDNKVTFTLPDVEIGQGIYTAASMLLAEELNIRLADISVTAALPNSVYILSGETTEITWGSGSTQKDWLPLQKSAALLREMLIQAAAHMWSIDTSLCRAEDGKIIGPSGMIVNYGEILPQMAQLPMLHDVALKTKNEYQFIGKSQPRVDTVDKIHGKAVYGVDLTNVKENLSFKTGLIIGCPVVGGKLASIDDQHARQIKGVVDVLKLKDAVCIVADHFWAASQAVEKLIIQWNYGNNIHASTSSIYKELESNLHKQAIVGYANSKDKIEVILDKSHKKYKFSYKQPMLAHAALEPLSCNVYMQSGSCEIWSCSQIPLLLQEQVASLLEIDQTKVIFHNLYVGGSFGRRLENQYILTAVQFAKQVNYPLKCIWSREEDFAQDCIRPPYLDHVNIGVDEKGIAQAIKHHIIGPSVTSYWQNGNQVTNDMDPDLLLGLNTMPYQGMHYQLNYTSCSIDAIRPGWWQGNGATRNIFVLETLIDELAGHAKKDPIEYRKLLNLDDRAKAVTDMVVLHSQWDQASVRGISRGFAIASVFGSYIAVVVEIELTAMSVVRLHRVIASIDCGIAVNPDQIAAQIEGGIIFGLGTALHNEIEIKQGQIVQRNFNQYRMLRMNEAPQIEVHIIQSDALPTGVGELGTIIVAPALTNALSSALGKRIYSLPLDNYLN